MSSKKAESAGRGSSGPCAPVRVGAGSRGCQRATDRPQALGSNCVYTKHLSPHLDGRRQAGGLSFDDENIVTPPVSERVCQRRAGRHIGYDASSTAGRAPGSITAQISLDICIRASNGLPGFGINEFSCDRNYAFEGTASDRLSA